MIRIVALLSLFTVGCPRPIPNPPPPPKLDMATLSECPAITPEPHTVDVCNGLSTPLGYQCVRCDVPVGCIYKPAMVYCTPACVDPYCGRPPR